MSVIEDILIEEYNRLKELADKYKSELAILPKGSISEKIIKNNKYYYLAYRKGNKVIFEYIGKKGARKYQEIEESLRKRKILENKLKSVKKDLKEIAKKL